MNQPHEAEIVQRFIADHQLANVDFNYSMMLDYDVVYTKEGDRWKVTASVSLYRYHHGIPQLLLMLGGILGRERPWFVAPTHKELTAFCRAHLERKKASIVEHDMLRAAGSLRQAFEMDYLLSREYVTLDGVRELARLGAQSLFYTSHVEFLCTMAALRTNGGSVQVFQDELLRERNYDYLKATDVIEAAIKRRRFDCADLATVFDLVYGKLFGAGDSQATPIDLEAIVRRVLGHPERNELAFDIALSYATENSSFVDPLAAALEAQGVTVFFDKHAMAELWGKDLYGHLSDIYARRARFCLMVLSKEYAAKQWTTVERKAAQSRALSENREYILPVRLDDSEIPGILPTTACIDGRQQSLSEITDFVLQKLHRRRRAG